MQNFSELLRQKNLKKTTLRLAILEIFSEKKTPLSIPDLEKLLAEKNFSQNQTSLYRQIESLTTSGMVQLVMLKNSTTHYELQTHHHHHFVCDGCEKIFCTEDDALEQKIHEMEESLKEKGFFVNDHQFSFHGKCENCHQEKK